MSSDDIFETSEKREVRKDELRKKGILTKKDEAQMKPSVVSTKLTKKEYGTIQDFTKHTVEEQHNHKNNKRKKPRSSRIKPTQKKIRLLTNYLSNKNC